VAFIWDDGILSRIKDRHNRRVSFIHESLQELDLRLKAHGSRLIIRRGIPEEEIPKVALEIQAERVTFGEDYEPFAIHRDTKVLESLGKMGIEAKMVKDSVIFHKGEVLTASGGPFKVYSPYSRAWKAIFVEDRDDAERTIDPKSFLPASALGTENPDWSLESLGFEPVALALKPGEEAGRGRLKAFRGKICDYGKTRDFPALENTSCLSVDFRFGTVSIREAVRMARSVQGEGAEKWLNELIWREFYKHILFHFPYVVERPFLPEFADVSYPGTSEHWELWRDGNTGYPLVDAAMRCLNATGTMHNRLRMVVASFLTKDLLLDYRKGEAWFAKQLLDYDRSSNNGGWQWAASVGCDPQPYFRIFNPILQSKKFDPDGVFIRRWVPELANLSGDAIHFPSELSTFELLEAGVELGVRYPHPCVDHGEQRVRAVALLESARKSGLGG
jgi:deoxyribodipyrimidine photo-lyase